MCSHVSGESFESHDRTFKGLIDASLNGIFIRINKGSCLGCIWTRLHPCFHLFWPVSQWPSFTSSEQMILLIFLFLAVVTSGFCYFYMSFYRDAGSVTWNRKVLKKTRWARRRRNRRYEYKLFIYLFFVRRSWNRSLFHTSELAGDIIAWSG